MILNNIKKESFATQVFVEYIHKELSPCEILAYGNEVIIKKDYKTIKFDIDFGSLFELIDENKMKYQRDIEWWVADQLISTIKDELKNN